MPDELSPVGLCPYCHQKIYEGYSTHCDHCEAFKEHLANMEVKRELVQRDRQLCGRLAGEPDKGRNDT